MSKGRSKYIASFDYFDKFATVIGAPVGIASTSFSLAFSIFTGIVKKLLKKIQNKKKKHNKILM